MIEEDGATVQQRSDVGPRVLAGDPFDMHDRACTVNPNENRFQNGADGLGPPAQCGAAARDAAARGSRQVG